MGPPPGAEAALADTEVAAQAQGEKLGLDYLQSTMSALDGAESYRDVINAFRGNDAPIEARYTELADLVGPDDAMRTPESVLTLVQPTIMMTEQGAVDSGIGQLMAQVTSNVDMGAEPQMEQGLGQLMAANQAPQMPPVQNFVNGGDVRGGDVSVRQYYDEYLPLYREVMGVGSEEAARRQRSLDLAQAGFALASGVDPATGKSMADQPLVSQISRTLQPFTQRQSERLAAQRQQEQAIQMGALQAASETRAGDVAARRAAEVAAAQRAHEREMARLDAALALTAQTQSEEATAALENQRQSGRVSLFELETQAKMNEASVAFLRQLEENIQKSGLAQGREAYMATLKDALDVAQDTTAFDRDLQTMAIQQEYALDMAGVKHDYTLERDDLLDQYDRTKILLNHINDLKVLAQKHGDAKELQTLDNAFKATQGTLDRLNRLDVAGAKARQANAGKVVSYTGPNGDLQAAVLDAKGVYTDLITGAPVTPPPNNVVVKKPEELRSALLALADPGSVDEIAAEITASGDQGVQNAFAAVQDGTGFWTNVSEAVDRGLSPITDLTGTGNFFAGDNQAQAKNYLRLLQNMSREAFALSGRPGQWEQMLTLKLVPDPDEFFTTPDKVSKQLLQFRRELEKVVAQDSADARAALRTGDYTQAKKISQGTKAMKRILRMIGPPPSEAALSAGSSDEDRRKLQGVLNNAVKINLPPTNLPPD